MIPRLIEKKVFEALRRRKIIIVLGARQVGKTTLLQDLMAKISKKTHKILYLNCDTEEGIQVVDTTSFTLLQKLTKDIEYLFIDEIQRLNNPGLTLKIIFDNLKKVKVIVTGSSSFELKNKLSESLTGRYIDFTLFPLSLGEIIPTISDTKNKLLRKQQTDVILREIVLFGQYPEVYLVKRIEDKLKLLNNIIESYLFKDILSFQSIRNPQIIKDLTKAIAYQIGSEVNENELANRLKVNRKTVVSYLDILEKSFVIKRMYPFSKNPRREIGRRFKIYFLDLGIRNALTGDFNDLSLRQDTGDLWENFIIMERLKYCENNQKLVESYFWRSYGGAEVDYLEMSKVEASMKAYEIKLKKEKVSRGAKEFTKRYKIPVTLVNQENYLDFLT